MVTILIGHRGVGKTTLLNRLYNYSIKYNIDAQAIDLDEYIETKENTKIKNIFSSKGESSFRKLEKKYLKEIITNIKTRTYISVGAGFMGPYPENVEIIFVKRSTDKNGRTFLNRPRLNNRISAFDEYKELYKKREQHYANHSNKILILQEGLRENNTYEELFFGFTKEYSLNGVYTLLPNEFNNIRSYLDWGIDKLEVRTDFFNTEAIEKIKKIVPEEKLIISVRGTKSIAISKYMDWPLEQGAPNKKYHIISSHSKKLSVEEAVLEIDSYAELAEHLKLAIPINSLEELKIGHMWHLKNPNKNCFLPISDNGKFNWYRLIQKNKIYPNFFKTTEQGSALDQPLFYDWVNNSYEGSNGFAAIIGSPIDHSWTPNEQQKFFSKYNMPIVKINLSEEELNNNNLDFLTSLGLRAAAVTSPLKIKMNSLVSCGELKAVNTIVRFNNEWLSINTDINGFAVLAKKIQGGESTILWGGGGVIPSVKVVLPNISSYSARTGQPRDGELLVTQPNVVIWAIGRSKHKGWPNPSWKPSLIVDLNYSEDSPGKEYALMVGAEYISGEAMFIEQAKEQQNFWSKYL